MSIRVQIKSLVRDGRLILLTPVGPGLEIQRVILASRELLKDLNGPWESIEKEERFVRLRANLDNFISGEFITHNYLKALSPRTKEEVWEIRSLRPKPSLRVLGRFAEKDVFVALFQEERTPLGKKDSIEWNRVIRTTKAKWRGVFNPYEPLTGSELNDYVSNAADPKFFKR